MIFCKRNFCFTVFNTKNARDSNLVFMLYSGGNAIALYNEHQITPS